MVTMVVYILPELMQLYFACGYYGCYMLPCDYVYLATDGIVLGNIYKVEILGTKSCY